MMPTKYTFGPSGHQTRVCRSHLPTDIATRNAEGQSRRHPARNDTDRNDAASHISARALSHRAGRRWTRNHDVRRTRGPRLHGLRGLPERGFVVTRVFPRPARRDFSKAAGGAFGAPDGGTGRDLPATAGRK
jgi:hypothetical protein